MAVLFLSFVALVSTVLCVAVTRWVSWHASILTASALSVWLAYVGLLGWSGVLGDPSVRPPGPAFILAPVLLLLVAVIVRGRSPEVTRIARDVPLWALLGAQVFRVGVELFLHRLWSVGVVPKMMTFEGANADVYVGLSAPAIAWWSTRRRWGRVAETAWNVLGLLALANVVGRAILTTPGPLNLLQSEVPDRMFGTFPYMYIPGFFVPLALTLHVLALRAAVVQNPSVEGECLSTARRASG